VKLLKVLTLLFLFIITSTPVVFAREFEELYIANRYLDTKTSQVPISYANSMLKLTELTKYRIPILMYHYIGPRNDPDDITKNLLSTWPQILDEQIKTLKNAGYTFLKNDELADILDTKKEIPQKPVVLTFDDGYKDFYTNAYPILKKYNAKATNFVISGFINNLNHLSTGELKELSKDENIEIGAHTVNHEWLKDQNADTSKYETLENKHDLENITGKQVASFAYPYGAFDEAAIKTVKESGFRSAVSTLPGIIESNYNRFFMYRIRPGERVGQVLLDWLNQETFNAF
jgi:peptidoglycan/xylan/chitin deacetylase (PgdA/CDA1 family)